MIYQRVHILLIAFLGSLLISGNPPLRHPDREMPFSPVSMDATDSLLATMDLDEKLMQFFVAKKAEPGFSNALIIPFSAINEVGFDGERSSLSLVGIDLINDPSVYAILGLPKAPLLSSVKDPETIYGYALQLGHVLRAKGVDFVIGPSLDIEINDDSPYTSLHSFGNDIATVSEKAQSFVDGMRTAGVMCVAGHFPGLGNTLRGADANPPMIYSKRKELNNRDLVPFKALINDGLQGVMMASAFAPGMDSTLNATAASSIIAHQTLKGQLGFQGLAWCDLSTEINLQERTIQEMFLAGNDLIILSNELNLGIDALKDLIRSGTLNEQQIDERCKRILQLKLWTERKPQLVSSGVFSDRMIKLGLKERQLFSDALVLLKNDGVVPFQALDTLSLAIVKLSDSTNKHLPGLIGRYAPADVFQLNNMSLEKDFQIFEAKAGRYDHIIIIGEPTNADLDKRRFGLSEHAQSIIDRISTSHRTTLVWNGNAKALRSIATTSRMKAVLLGHEVSAWSDDLTIQALFGGREIKGELHRKIDDRFHDMPVIRTEKIRLAYGLPEEVGIDRNDLKKIDSIAKKGIEEMAYPGCQVWFAKDGIVVVNNPYGYHTYQAERSVKNTDLYDLASITKIAGSVAGLMRLTEEGQFNLDNRLCDYLSEWVDTTTYMQLNMREILAHQAGLTPWIPFYTKTVTKGVPRYDVYSLAASETYPLRVAREFYIRSDYPDKMFRQILNHDLAEKTYKYSDIGYYFALRIIEKQTGTSLDRFLDSTYYRPLGLTTMGFRPLERFEKSEIAPTEYDRYFRNQLVHGDVHDPGAAMLGGVGGHAGLFSDANDLGVMMQMYLNGGFYGGQRFFGQEVIDDFTKCQFCEDDNRRGAGFDKPLTDGSEGPSCGCTSLDAFGHQGFTGTVTWADPDEKVVYVFLSNRVYPDANNKKLLELNIRTEIQKEFYRAIERGKDLATGDQSSID
ncbi:MAG: serine hydrolase [Flavobacteriales bacterium]|nr:serine hydrolase [Flavobacteriales bacterium]